MRALYLDDSGKVHPNDSTTFAVLGGFSVDLSRWHTLCRQISGAKSRYFPKRGPHEWEVKSIDFLPENAWSRRSRRELCLELLDILRRNQCHTYVVYLEKSKAVSTPAESTLVPLMVQRLLLKYLAELESQGTSGMVISDWSTHQLDHHISECVQSMVASRQLTKLVGGVTYGSSASLSALQVCDLIASGYRRSLEGAEHLVDLRRAIDRLRYIEPNGVDVDGYLVDSVVKLF